MPGTSCAPETRVMRLTWQLLEFGVQRADVRKTNCILVAIVYKGNLHLALHGRYATNLGPVPCTIRKFRRDEITGFGRKTGRWRCASVVSRKVAHQLCQ
jgi:hypothetical protein